MKSNALMFTSLGLLLCWLLPVASTKIAFGPREAKRTTDIIQLDMVENAVDDMYFGCNKTMTDAVENTYFPNEEKSAVWKKMQSCAIKKLNKREKGDEALTKHHMQAICLYTAGNRERFYISFNEAVRTNRSIYNTSFPFHSVHFWLTSAVQILSDNTKQCQKTFRRTKLTFTGKINETIRFGSFASSSYNPSLTHFGKETCFSIKTCFGAYLKEYSYLGLKEKEVLIPPYEMFKITEKRSSEDLPDCKVTYSLESAGVHSNLNCKVARLQ